jgi:hypothetical protein
LSKAISETAPAAELEADRRDYQNRSPKVALLTQHDMLKDLVPTPKVELSAEEQKIRTAELAEETLLQAELGVSKAATAKAAADLMALRKRSRAAGGMSFMTAVGLESKPADVETQMRCNELFPFAEDAFNKAREAEEAAYMRYRATCNKHGWRRTRAWMLEGLRPADPGRVSEIRLARAQRLQAFLNEKK